MLLVVAGEAARAEAFAELTPEPAENTDSRDVGTPDWLSES
jgi:hypothetical protein